MKTVCTAAILAVYFCCCSLTLAADSECFAKNPSTGDCVQCPGEVQWNQCPDFEYGACNTKADCEATLDPPCYAMNGWSESAQCQACPETHGVANLCPSFGYTQCNTQCSGNSSGGEPTSSPNYPSIQPAPTPAPVTRPTAAPAPRPTAAPVPRPTAAPVPRPTAAPAPRPTAAPVPRPTSAAGNEETGCFAARWNDGVCQACPENSVDPTGTACLSMSWAPCFNTMSACQESGGNSGGGNGGDGGSCGGCPANSLSMSRPTWSGPSCYVADSKFPIFGPNWAPGGRTNFEKYVKSPDDIYKIAQWLDWGAQPIMNGAGLSGCDAAVIMYESIVCAIEYIMLSLRQFDYSAVGGSSRSVSELFGSGDERTDLFEVLALLAHAAKETGQFVTWIEGATGYAEPHDTYPPVAGKSYQGRGPIQLSYNYNYGPFSEWLYGDKNVFLNNPDAVDAEGPGGWIAAIWFWMTPHDFSGNYVGGAGGTVSPHDALRHWFDGGMSAVYGTSAYDKAVGMGLSTDIINGGIECTGNPQPNAQRVQYFLTFLNRLGYEKYMPDLSSAAACEADAACYGLYAGCGSSFGLPNYDTSRTNACGAHYIAQ